MPTPRLRSLVQALFILLCLWIGVEFFLFVHWGQSGGAATFVPRPPGAEGFLPISALMSLRHLWLSGQVHPVHPAGFFILMAVLGTALLLKKAFCSWLCPVGTLSEVLANLGQRLFKRNLRPPLWLDWPLRALKYLLLLFFVWAILAMSPAALEAFLDGPYNRMADVKMYLFFANLSLTGLVVLLVLALLSVVIRGFWCRYLCPYGALLGLASLLSPLKVTRRAETCTGCGKCTRVCPARIKVEHATRVRSDECTACFQCVEACPVKDTLALRLPGPGPRVPLRVFAVLVVGLFVGITGAAVLAGKWQNRISREEYLQRFPELNGPDYEHVGKSMQRGSE